MGAQLEVRNTLITGERRGRLTEDDTASFLHGISRLGIHVDRTPAEAAVLMIARRHRLTVYDASYLELALREAMPLSTPDQALLGAAQAMRVAVLGVG